MPQISNRSGASHCGDVTTRVLRFHRPLPLVGPGLPGSAAGGVDATLRRGRPFRGLYTLESHGILCEYRGTFMGFYVNIMDISLEIGILWQYDII